MHLADRVDALIDRRHAIAPQITEICEKINGDSGKKFKPGLVKAFQSLARKKSFWLDATSPTIKTILARRAAKGATLEVDEKGLMSLAKLFGRIIDFRSRFTAVHSSGVAACC